MTSTMDHIQRPVKMQVQVGSTYRWEQVLSAAPFTPRDGAGALTYRDRMWLIGGWNSADPVNFPRDCVNDVWSSADGREWREDKPNTFGTDAFDADADWEGRHTAGYVVHDDKMWIVGGDVIQSRYHSDLWCSQDGVHWTKVQHDAPWGPRALHHTVAFDGYIWVMGGQTAPQFIPEKEVFYNDIWRSRDGVNWEPVKPIGPHWSPRGMIGGAAVLNGRMWVLGGGTYDTPDTPQRKFFNEVWSTEDGQHWTCHTRAAEWSPRQYHEVAVFDDRLWVLEGYGQEEANRNDVWYSDDGANWTQVPDTPWAPRHAASVFVHDNALWMVAGNNMESDVWKLTRDHTLADA